MTETTINILITTIPPTLVALTGLVVGVLNVVKSNKIHILVNSNMTKVQADLTIAKQRIEALQTSIATTLVTKLTNTE